MKLRGCDKKVKRRLVYAIERERERERSEREEKKGLVRSREGYRSGTSKYGV